MPNVSSERLVPAPTDQWRTYDEFAAGIDTYRLPSADLSGVRVDIRLDGGPNLGFEFLDPETVRWSGDGAVNTGGTVEDPYDAVQVREDVFFVNLPRSSAQRTALTVVFSTRSHRALAVASEIQAERQEGVPQVSQVFWVGSTNGGQATGEIPGPSRDLIGQRNVYRYSPYHLYEHVYLSSERYSWQCLQGVQRGHADTDLSTVWKFEDGLYLFCFREFKIAVASVWLHDLGYDLRTTGIFLGLNGRGQSEHSKAGGHVFPLGSVRYPDAQPI